MDGDEVDPKNNWSYTDDGYLGFPPIYKGDVEIFCVADFVSGAVTVTLEGNIECKEAAVAFSRDYLGKVYGVSGPDAWTSTVEIEIEEKNGEYWSAHLVAPTTSVE